MTLLSILGLLVAIFAAIMLMTYPSMKRKKDSTDEFDDAPPSWLLWFNKERSWRLLVTGLLFFMVSGMFFIAKPGTAYAIQYLWGGDQAIYTQGVKLKLWGRTIPISFDIPVQDIILELDTGGNPVEPLPSDDDIYYREAQEWEFNDAIKGRIDMSVIVSIDRTNDEVFLTTADRNKGEDKLVYARVMPNIDAALKNTCKLISAQDYIAGASAEFDRYFRDQLENGMYILEEYYEFEESNEVIGDSSTTRKIISDNSKSKQKKYRIMRQGGEPVRDNSNSMKQYGLTVTQAQIRRIDWESEFDKRLQLQKEQVAQTQLEKQEAQKEFYRTQKEIAKGEAEKAKERARLEKEQIQKTIDAETKAKVAEFNLVEEKKKYEVEQYKAKSKKVAADAQYYENQKLVAAGLTPQERVKFEKETAIGVAAEISKLTLPGTYIISGDKQGGSGILEQLIGAEMAKRMMTK